MYSKPGVQTQLINKIFLYGRSGSTTNCEVGNFISKCPYKNNSDGEGHSFKEINRGKAQRKTYFQKRKKIIYSK